MSTLAHINEQVKAFRSSPSTVFLFPVLLPNIFKSLLTFEHSSAQIVFLRTSEFQLLFYNSVPFPFRQSRVHIGIHQSRRSVDPRPVQKGEFEQAREGGSRTDALETGRCAHAPSRHVGFAAADDGMQEP